MVFCRLLFAVMLHKLDEQNQAQIVQSQFLEYINMWEIIEQNDREGQCASYPGTNLE